MAANYTLRGATGAARVYRTHLTVAATGSQGPGP
jgi:hypothetical protein